MTPLALSSRLTSVPLSTIDLTDERYRLSRGPANAALLASVRAVGCLCPPICLARDDRPRLRVVAGFKRLHAVRESSGHDGEVTVRVLDSMPGDPLRPLIAAAWDARRDGTPSPFACSRAIGRAVALGADRARVASDLLPALGLEPHESVVKRYRQLQRCPVGIQDWLEQRGASLKRALRFVRTTDDQASLLLALADRYHFSLRALEEAAAMLGDIARRDEISWTAVAERANLRGEVSIADAKSALRALWRLRYRDWARRQQLAEQRARDVDLPEHASLSWDDRFERDGLSLRLEVTDVAGLQRDLEHLLEADRLARFESLLESL